MKERIPYQSFGEPAFTADGVPYAQFPDDLWGDLGRGLMIALRVLLKLWNGLTGTDASREHIRILVNELRAEKGLPPITSRRAITWYFSELKKLGVISRERDETDKRVWKTWFTKPFLARTNRPEGPAAIEPRTGSPNVSAAEPAAEPVVKTVSEQREETAESSLRFLSREKWFNPLNDKGEPLLGVDGRLVWRAKAGAMDLPPLVWEFARKFDAEMQALIARDPDIRALIEAARPARE